MQTDTPPEFDLDRLTSDPQQHSPIDADFLLDRCLGNAALALLMLEDLETNGPNQMALIDALATAGEMLEAANTAHSVRGAAAIMGAQALSECAKQVEYAGNDGDPQRLSNSVQAMQSEMARCVAFIPCLRAGLQ